MNPIILDRPLVAFDIESSGTDVSKDRIITLAALQFIGRFSDVETIAFKRRVWTLNPGIPIPESASRVHGITNEMVKDKPTFKDVAMDVFVMFSGADLLGYNIRNFDVPLLWEEFNRAGIDWKVESARIVDACAIFRKKEPRDLEAAVRKYVGGDHSGAHDAEADAVATVSVLLGQRRLYQDVSQMDVAALTEFSREDDEFDGQKARRLDLAGHIIQTADGVARYTLKKVRGVPVLEDRGFGGWMLRNDFPEHTKRVLRRLGI